MHHVGHYVDAWHQAAGKSETLRDGVVMHLVFGLFCGVVGLDAPSRDITGHCWFPRHFVRSMLRDKTDVASMFPACFARIFSSHGVPRASIRISAFACPHPASMSTPTPAR